MGLYEFKPEDAYRFAQFIHIHTKERGNELWFKTCPFCRGSGKGNEKTFSINLTTGVFNCFRESCKRQGNMIDLSREFDFSLGTAVDEYFSPKKKFRKLPMPKEPIVPKEPAIKYLESRGISKAIADKYQITSQTDHPNVLCMPFIDDKGIWQFIKYRDTEYVKGQNRNKEWCEKDCKPILYGMYQCNPANKTLILNEGQLDSLSVAQAGIENAISVPTGANGFTWVPYCWNWVNQFETIIVFGDYEKGHITLLDDIKKRFTKLRIKHVREEAYRDCKDANDILRKYGEAYIRACIETAVDVPIESIINLADVPDVNVYDLEKMKSGINDLDAMLYGGLYFGGVTLITSKSGRGKSSFASQIIANALQQGYKCFAYSGELANHLFKAWIDFQLAGSNHVITYRTKYGNDGYKISDTNKELIHNWYNENIFIYDSTAVTDEKKDLVYMIEEVIVRYGVRVILVDNLMTALDLDNDRDTDKYERQSKFVKALVRIAMKFDVLILLVAHKRKNGMYANDESDEVSGSSDIINLTSITLSYDMGSKKDIADGLITEEQRKLKLLKNRVFGVVNTEGWILDFDPKSKRIYGVHDDPDKEYGWTKQLKNGFDDADTTNEDLPWD